LPAFFGVCLCCLPFLGSAAGCRPGRNRHPLNLHPSGLPIQILVRVIIPSSHLPITLCTPSFCLVMGSEEQCQLCKKFCKHVNCHYKYCKVLRDNKALVVGNAFWSFHSDDDEPPPVDFVHIGGEQLTRPGFVESREGLVDKATDFVLLVNNYLHWHTLFSK